METCGIDDDGCRGNSSEDASRHPRSRETRDARLMPPDYFETVETGSVPSTKPYACVDCRYATDRKNNLRRHRATMHERCERALECCGLTFVSKSELREHVTENHGAGAGYACAECGRRFGRRALMRRHAAIHDGRPAADGARRRSTGVVSIGRRYACSECDYTTGHKSNLDRHFRRHGGLHSTAAADSQSPFTSDNRYSQSKTRNDTESTALSGVNQRDLGVPLNGCCCHICLCTSYYRHQLPPSPSSTTSLSSTVPFMFNLLPPRLEDLAWSFRESILPNVGVRRMWSPYAEDRGPSTEANGDRSIPGDDLIISMDSTTNQVEVGDVLYREESDDRPTSSTGSAGDKVSDAAANDVTGTCYQRRRQMLSLLRSDGDGQLKVVDELHLDEPGDRSTSLTPNAGCSVAPDTAATGDVTGTCQRRRRLRLLPLLHTCRSCSLTFVSQLQLKFHSDLFHRVTDLDVAAARPICCRLNQPDSQPPVF